MNRRIRIAVASGKGGTGKTTVSTSLALSLSENGYSVRYADCDVEEPNGHIFLKPDWVDEIPVNKLIPVVDQAKCIHCSKCSRICRFSAILDIGAEVLTFPDLCRACGGCTLVCPVAAISEKAMPMGVVRVGAAGSLQVAQGELHIGEHVIPPVIHAVLSREFQADIDIVDAPPGTACPMIEAVRESDFILLVTEPTPFGLHDLKLALDVLGLLRMPYGVILNRADLGDARVYHFCKDHRIPILMEIDNDENIARGYARGDPAIRVKPSLKADFLNLFQQISERVSQ